MAPRGRAPAVGPQQRCGAVSPHPPELGVLCIYWLPTPFSIYDLQILSSISFVSCPSFLQYHLHFSMYRIPFHFLLEPLATNVNAQRLCFMSPYELFVISHQLKAKLESLFGVCQELEIRSVITSVSFTEPTPKSVTRGDCYSLDMGALVPCEGGCSW